MASKKEVVGALQKALNMSEADIKASNGNIGPKTQKDLQEYGYLPEVQVVINKGNNSTITEISNATSAIIANSRGVVAPPVDIKSKNPFQDILDKLSPAKTSTGASETPNQSNNMANNTKDSNLGKMVGYGQIGGLAGIGYAFYKKTGFWKGAGLYLLGSFVGALAAAAVMNITKKDDK